ncbi:MAG: hypothetical protein DRO40_05870 [Thermoprotei archaeon]|nr:MAG: hypothetical protein DRO40_05870 [Thermoprotei archaeon]
MKAVIYARVSIHGEDIGNQIEAIREWAREHNYEVALGFLMMRLLPRLETRLKERLSSF